MNFKLIREQIKKIPFLDSSITLGPMQLVRFATGPLKSKAIALFSGVAGVGFLGIGTQTQMLGTTMASISMGPGFTSRLSRVLAQGKMDEKRSLMGTAFTLQLLLNGSLCLIGLILTRPLSHWIFGPQASPQFLIPILFSIPCISLIQSYYACILYAHGRYDLFSKANTVYAVLEALIFALGVYFFKITGAFWCLFVCSVVWSLIMLVQVAKVERLKDVHRIEWHSEHLRYLVQSSGIILVAGFSSYGINILIRILIGRHLGDVANGIYQVILVISAYYTPFLINGIWARLYPKISGDGATVQTLAEWSDSLTLTAALACLAQLMLMLAPSKLISLFYTKEFLTATSLLPLQLIGDYFFLLSQSCMAVTLGLGYRKTYLTVWLISNGTFGLLSWALIGRFGLMAVLGAYAGSNLFMLLYGMGLHLQISSRFEGGRERSLRTLKNLMPPLLTVLGGCYLFYTVASPLPRIALTLAWLGCIAMAVRIPRLRRSFLSAH